MDEKDITGFYKLLIHAMLEQMWRILWVAILLGIGAWAAFSWLAEEEEKLPVFKNTTHRENGELMEESHE